jgi:hypothetical protein
LKNVKGMDITKLAKGNLKWSLAINDLINSFRK